jgi:Transposase
VDGAPSMGQAGERRTTLTEKLRRSRVQVAAPMRDLSALVPAEAVPYDVHGREVRVNLKLLSYCIPFVAGVGIMVGGMKTAGTPFLGLPQLVAGIVLTAVACWYFVSDSGRLDLERPRPRPAPPSVGVGEPRTADDSERRSPKKYTDEFRRHAVMMVRSTGWPIARVARELDVNPATLGGWVKKDRVERAGRGGSRAEVVPPPPD